MTGSRDEDDSPKRRMGLAVPTGYEVGYGKPPVTSRFQPGHSGNPKGRPRGARNKLPALHEERTRTLIMAEAYRTVSIVERGRQLKIPMITAVLRALALNAVKGNNRAAVLFTKLVGETEAKNKKLAAEAFVSMMNYKDLWTRELRRRKRFNLKLPDPVPHPEDIVIDARNMSFRVVGPWTHDEIPRFKLGSELLSAYQEATAQLQEKLVSMAEGPGREKLLRNLRITTEIIAQLKPHYGPRSERTKDPLIREAEELLGQPFDMSEFD